jgi:hypothetical protein
MEQPEKKQSDNNQEEPKKIVPEAVEPEDEKRAYDEEAMAIVDEMWKDDDDAKIVGSDVDEEAKKLNEKNEKQKEEKPKSEFIEEEPEPEEPEPQEEKKETVSEEPEQKQPLKLSEKAEKALSPYSGELSNKIEQLARANAELKAKLNSYGNVANTIKELGLDGVDNEQIVDTMKDYKDLHRDLQNPKFLNVVTAVASGDFSNIPGSEVKTVSNFLPEDEDYDAHDAMNDPASPSWIAREKWEKHQREQQKALNDLMDSINGRKEGLTDVEKQLKESKKILGEKLGEVKSFALQEYDVGENDFNDFVSKFKQFDTSIIKVAWAVYAKQNGIKNKLSRKLEENKGKAFAETEISKTNQKELEIGGSFEISQEENKKYKNVFADWNDGDDQIYR